MGVGIYPTLSTVNKTNPKIGTSPELGQSVHLTEAKRINIFFLLFLPKAKKINMEPSVPTVLM